MSQAAAGPYERRVSGESRPRGPRRELAAELPPGAPEVLLQPRPFVLTGLPYRRTQHREITRTARVGKASWLRVTYLATDSRFPLPFGADRGLLAWITTQAFATGAVRFSAITEYFRAFGLDPGGRGYRLFRERFERIAHLAIRIEQIDQDARTVRKLFLIPQPVEPRKLLEGPVGDLERKVLSYERYGFELDPGFWEYLKATRVPTPLALLRKLHARPLAWDLTQLVLYRCFAAKKPSAIPWRELAAQLGSQDQHRRRLRARVKAALAEIRTVAPGANAELDPRTGSLLVGPPGARPVVNDAPPPAQPAESPRRPATPASQPIRPAPAGLLREEDVPALLRPYFRLSQQRSAFTPATRSAPEEVAQPPPR